MPPMPSPATTDAVVKDSADEPSVRSRFWRGVQLGTPIFLGYVPVGAAFGILARTIGFTVWQATLCSATALAGAGQFIALSFLGNGALLGSALAATTVINLRYVLFASTLAPFLRGERYHVLAPLAFTLTDETFAVNISDHRRGHATPASMIGVGVVSWTGWVLGTLAGAAGASWIGDPSRFGVEFAMPAMFSALFVALAENRRHVVAGIFAGALVLTLPLLDRAGIHIATSWHLIIASMTAATLAAVVDRGKRERSA